MKHLSLAVLTVAAATFATFANPTHASAQEIRGSFANRLLATRAALESEWRRLSADPSPNDADRRLSAEIRARLEQGDFRPGDRVVLEVVDEPALTDTFTVTGARTLPMPPPATEPMALEGVLRSELEDHARDFLNRFLVNASVRAHSLVRLSVHGEVARGGFHGLPPGAALADLLVAAGGTTPDADADEMYIARNGEKILENEELQTAFAQGRTIDQALLQEGDQLIVQDDGGGGFQDNLRFLWVIVSLAGGIYGLSRAF
jgi:hypothetical protein